MEQMKVYAIMKLQNKLSTLASELEITPKRKEKPEKTLINKETQPLAQNKSATSISKTTQNSPQFCFKTHHKP